MMTLDPYLISWHFSIIALVFFCVRAQVSFDNHLCVQANLGKMGMSIIWKLHSALFSGFAIRFTPNMKGRGGRVGAQDINQTQFLGKRRNTFCPRPQSYLWNAVQ